MTRKGILSGGTWCVDYNKLLDQWPAENGRADIQSIEISGGGSGCNLAIDIKRLDPQMPVATIGLVGDDAGGRILFAEADAHGIDRTQFIAAADAETDFTDAFASQATGRRTHISYFNSSHRLTPDHFDFSRATHRFFHLGLPGIHRLMDGPWKGEANGWVATLKQARAAGFATNMELASIERDRLAALLRPCLAHLDFLIVNDHEIGGIAGLETVRDGKTDVAACKAAAAAALKLGVGRLVAVHFPGGAIVASRDGATLAMPSVKIPAAAIAGANGAGDAFAAGFLYGLHENWSLDEALRLAHAAAAASLRRITTYGGVESWPNCLALAKQWGWREALQ